MTIRDVADMPIMRPPRVWQLGGQLSAMVGDSFELGFLIDVMTGYSETSILRRSKEQLLNLVISRVHCINIDDVSDSDLLKSLFANEDKTIIIATANYLNDLMFLRAS